MASGIEIRQAGVRDVDLVAPLFDAYRQFYRQASDPERAESFVRGRLQRSESAIFLAMDGAAPAGFTQLYPSFSSLSTAPIYILNDLFVAPEARGRGVASALLRAAASFARESGAIRLTLSTELTNSTAQAVYDRLGWKRDTDFCVYQLAL